MVRATGRNCRIMLLFKLFKSIKGARIWALGVPKCDRFLLCDAPLLSDNELRPTSGMLHNFAPVNKLRVVNCLQLTIEVVTQSPGTNTGSY